VNKEQLLIEHQKLRAELKIFTSDIRMKPEMKNDYSLKCCSRGKGIDYYKVRGEERIYLGADKEKEKRELARKELWTRTLEAAEAEIKQLDRCIEILERGYPVSDIDRVYPLLHRGVRELTGPVAASNDGYAIQWVKKYARFKNQTRATNGSLKTARGEIVRSKSELIIADKLHSAGVPYIYEVSVSFMNDDYMRRLPDFFVLNKRTRKEFFWEHFGMMDNPEYCAEAQFKMDIYAKNGYFPGKNLLITFESSKVPLNTGYVDMLIKEYLL